ncbi:MAG: FAD-binding protein, partial [Planctomycetaceae bacterium]|nr:FAD-binding protein [Planctomycetaceae bacterium]
AVTTPKSTDDVKAIVAYATEHQIPVIPRGSGTGLAGGCLGTGIVIDFSRWMNRILEIGTSTARVQPGVILNDLNTVLRSRGLYFAPDPSNASITTLGGMIGVDAAGSHAVGVGSTRDHLKTLEVVLSDASEYRMGRERVFLQNLGSERLVSKGNTDPFARIQVILRRLMTILQENRELIEQHQPCLLRNTAGYMLRGVLQKESIDFPRMFAGSEGTLGVCTEAEIHLLPLPEHRRGVLLIFSRFDEATACISRLLDFEPSACDLVDRRLLMLAREASPEYARIIPQHAAAALIVEFQAWSEAMIERRLSLFRDFIERHVNEARVAQVAVTAQQIDHLWQLPRQVVPLLTRLQGVSRPVPFIEDIVVPPERLGDFLHQAQRTLQRFQVTASLYAHAGSGQLHLRPFLELPNKENASSFEALARDLYRLVGEMGGSISGEHGDGLSRTAFLRSQYGPMYRVLQQIKQLFDPHGLMNPDKVVSGDPHLTVKHFRPDGELLRQEPLVPLQLNWQDLNLVQETSLCNGCGICKTDSPARRMCPFHHQDPSELTSPRAKANLLRHYVSRQSAAEGEDTAESLDQLSAEQMLNSCFNCKQCQLECPAEVDIPHMWLEAKSNHVLKHGLSRSDWYLSRVDRLAELGWRFSWLVNSAFRSRTGKWLLQKLIGIDARRKLPRLASRPYLEQFARRQKKQPQGTGTPASNGSKPVVLFVDYFANYHDPEVALALEAILRHNGIRYLVPEEQTVSGMSAINVGDLVYARQKAEQNIRVLGTLAREGHTILCVDPNAAVCLKQEYPFLLDHPDAKVIANQTRDVGLYLVELLGKGQLAQPTHEVPLRIVYHEPCHQRALKTKNPYMELMSGIPSLDLQLIDRGCSGMAGHFGLAHRDFDRSIAMGHGLIDAMQTETYQLGMSECTGCRLQMEYGAAQPVVHPLKVLAASYGLVELNKKKSGETLTVVPHAPAQELT